MSEQALSDIAVLDLSQFVSGPYCTKLLADFGADVVKVERTEGGDVARQCMAGGHEHEDSPLFLYLNTGKRSIALDITRKEDAALVRDLARKADVVVESFRPGELNRFGLSYDQLSKVNPDLVMVSITPFGQNGPYSEYRSSEMVSLALGGLMYLTGMPEREPLKLGGFQAHYQTGLHAAVATLAALSFRDETGSGQHIDIAEVEVVASILEDALVAYTYEREIRKRNGSRRHSNHPVDILPCKDGYIAVVLPTWMDVEVFARLANIPDLLDRRFHSTYSDPSMADEIDALIVRWLEDKTRSEIFEVAQLLRLPFAPVLDIGELLSDPQLLARSYFIDLEHPSAGVLTYPGAPFAMSETPAQHRRAPLLGEHTREVLKEWLGRD